MTLAPMRIRRTGLLALTSMAVAVVGGCVPTAQAVAVSLQGAAGSTTWQVVAVNPNRPTQSLAYGSPITIAADGRGDVYLADQGQRRVRKFSPEGRLLWSTNGFGRRRGFGPTGIAVDRWGDIYLADTAIVKLSPTGRVLARWGTGQLANPESVATGGRGNVFALYGTGVGARIEKLSPQGRMLATWSTMAGRDFYAAMPGALAVDPSGRVYLTLLAAAYCYQLQCPSYQTDLLVQKLSPTGKLIGTWGGKNACCRNTDIGGPVGNVAVDGRGNVYLAGWDPGEGQNHVEKFSSSGKLLAKWGQPGCGPAQFAGKLSMAVGGRGTIYVADWVLGQDGEPGLIHVLALDGTPRSLWGTCPDMPSQPLRRPSDMAVDVQGTVYVINQDRGDVSSTFSSAGTWLAQWRHAYEDQNGDSTALMLTAIAIDTRGNVYVGGTRRPSGFPVPVVRKLSPHGDVLTSWDLPPTGQSDRIRGIAVDKQGSIFVVSQPAGHSRLLRLAPDGKSWTEWDRWFGATRPVDLWGLALDAHGNVYVVDAGNHCIQKLSSVGEPLACVKGDARYIAVDSQGSIYLSGLDRVQKLSATGELLATCDTKGSAPGQFNGPMGIAVDSHDNVYVADTRNDRIQKLVIGPRERASRNDLQHLRNLLSVTVPPVMSQFPPL